MPRAGPSGQSYTEHTIAAPGEFPGAFFVRPARHVSPPIADWRLAPGVAVQADARTMSSVEAGVRGERPRLSPL
jgi:hypothetical protein